MHATVTAALALLLALAVHGSGMGRAGGGAGLPPDTTPVRPPVRPLPFLYDLYTFRGDTGTLVVAAYAVEAGDLEREHVRGGVRYRFDVSLVLNDTTRRTVLSRHDSVHVDLPHSLHARHLLLTVIEMETLPSHSIVQRVYMYNTTSPGIGQLYMTPFTVPDYSGDELMLSDVVLGQPDSGGGWPRRGLAIAILPGRQFAGSAFEIYYEIYNLPRGHDYVTELAVAPLAADDDAGEALVRLRFEGEAATSPDGVLQEIRRVDSSLPRGRYRMTVTITDRVTGRTAARHRDFEVHAGRGAATMVPALPVTGSAIR
jgi:hypothetical protein